MKLAIVGSRSLNVDISKFINCTPDCIITGGAVGVDRSACIYANKNKIKLVIFRPNYIKFGKIAPIMRNNKIVNCCDSVLAIWDGYSHGTLHMIKTTKRANKPLKVFVAKNAEFERICNNEVQISLF